MLNWGGRKTETLVTEIRETYPTQSKIDNVTTKITSGSATGAGTSKGSRTGTGAGGFGAAGAAAGGGGRAGSSRSAIQLVAVV